MVALGRCNRVKGIANTYISRSSSSAASKPKDVFYQILAGSRDVWENISSLWEWFRFGKTRLKISFLFCIFFLQLKVRIVILILVKHAWNFLKCFLEEMINSLVIFNISILAKGVPFQLQAEGKGLMTLMAWIMNTFLQNINIQKLLFFVVYNR